MGNTSLVLSTTCKLHTVSVQDINGSEPLLSAPPAELSGVGSMSSKPQDTLCLPPRRQEGEPGPPSRSSSLKTREIQGGYTL